VKKKVLEEQKGQGEEVEVLDPYSMFIFSMNSRITQKKYTGSLTRLLDSCDLTYRQQAEKIAYLQSKKIALEDLVRRFENNNEQYLKINQTIKK
jgi:hypothetical protein